MDAFEKVGFGLFITLGVSAAGVMIVGGTYMIISRLVLWGLGS